jgi:hypothetical protein
VSVRTYGFPGCFTRPPGHLDSQPSPRADHVEACRPREYLCPSSVAGVRLARPGARDGGGGRYLAAPALPTNGKRPARPQTKTDAVPSRLRNPAGSGPRAFAGGWRGLTPRWPRSLRLGSASGFNVAGLAAGCNPEWTLIAHVPKKNVPGGERWTTVRKALGVLRE